MNGSLSVDTDHANGNFPDSAALELWYKANKQNYSNRLRQLATHQAHFPSVEVASVAIQQQQQTSTEKVMKNTNLSPMLRSNQFRKNQILLHDQPIASSYFQRFGGNTPPAEGSSAKVKLPGNIPSSNNSVFTHTTTHGDHRLALENNRALETDPAYMDSLSNDPAAQRKSDLRCEELKNEKSEEKVRICNGSLNEKAANTRKCQFCGKNFKFASNLEVHLLTDPTCQSSSLATCNEVVLTRQNVKDNLDCTSIEIPFQTRKNSQGSDNVFESRYDDTASLGMWNSANGNDSNGSARFLKDKQQENSRGSDWLDAKQVGIPASRPHRDLGQENIERDDYNIYSSPRRRHSDDISANKPVNEMEFQPPFISLPFDTGSTNSSPSRSILLPQRRLSAPFSRRPLSPSDKNNAVDLNIKTEPSSPIPGMPPKLLRIDSKDELEKYNVPQPDISDENRFIQLNRHDNDIGRRLPMPSLLSHPSTPQNTDQATMLSKIIQQYQMHNIRNDVENDRLLLCHHDSSHPATLAKRRRESLPNLLPRDVDLSRLLQRNNSIPTVQNRSPGVDGANRLSSTASSRSTPPSAGKIP